MKEVPYREISPWTNLWHALGKFYNFKCAYVDYCNSSELWHTFHHTNEYDSFHIPTVISYPLVLHCACTCVAFAQYSSVLQYRVPICFIR